MVTELFEPHMCTQQEFEKYVFNAKLIHNENFAREWERSVYRNAICFDGVEKVKLKGKSRSMNGYSQFSFVMQRCNNPYFDCHSEEEIDEFIKNHNIMNVVFGSGDFNQNDYEDDPIDFNTLLDLYYLEPDNA